MSRSLAGWAFVSLGSNQGDSRQQLADAIAFLQGLSPLPLLQSSLWNSAPLDCPPGSPNFLNAVVGLQPKDGETPESLFRQMQSFERQAGRRSSKTPNAPRLIDLDLIAFGSERRDTAELILPHPRATQRRFVLEPLAELAPELVLPGQSQPVRQLLKSIGTTQVLEPAGGF